jgi:hypothetical protein
MIMEMEELWIYWRWMHIPEWRYARQYFWVRLAINMGGKSTQTRVAMWIIFGSGRNVFVIEESS